MGIQDSPKKDNFYISVLIQTHTSWEQDPDLEIKVPRGVPPGVLRSGYSGFSQKDNFYISMIIQTHTSWEQDPDLEIKVPRGSPREISGVDIQDSPQKITFT